MLLADTAMASKQRLSAVLLTPLVLLLLIASARADRCACSFSYVPRSSFAEIVRQNSPVLATDFPVHNATLEWDFTALKKVLDAGKRRCQALLAGCCSAWAWAGYLVACSAWFLQIDPHLPSDQKEVSTLKEWTFCH